jgi:Ca-activated chloride channel family protein
MGRFRHQSSFLSKGPILSLLALAATSVLAQEPVFRGETTLVRVIVSVKDPRGQAIGDLQATDFKVFDSGVRQVLRVFEHHTEIPLSISILIDTSGSTNKDLHYETDSVEKFVKALLKDGNPEDMVSLYSFNHEVTLQADFSRKVSRVQSALGRLKAEAGTSLYDAVYLAGRQMEKRDGRHVMIIVTDGGDTTSKADFQAALRAAQFSESIVYPILVTPILGEPGRNLGGERVLAQLASNTGGRVFEPAAANQLDRNFEEILRDLRTQYLLAFRPENLPPNLPEFHPIRVEVSRPELRISTRSGYYGQNSGR